MTTTTPITNSPQSVSFRTDDLPGCDRQLVRLVEISGDPGAESPMLRHGLEVLLRQLFQHGARYVVLDLRTLTGGESALHQLLRSLTPGRDVERWVLLVGAPQSLREWLAANALGPKRLPVFDDLVEATEWLLERPGVVPPEVDDEIENLKVGSAEPFDGLVMSVPGRSSHRTRRQYGDAGVPERQQAEEIAHRTMDVHQSTADAAELGDALLGAFTDYSSVASGGAMPGSGMLMLGGLADDETHDVPPMEPDEAIRPATSESALAISKPQAPTGGKGAGAAASGKRMPSDRPERRPEKLSAAAKKKPALQKQLAQAVDKDRAPKTPPSFELDDLVDACASMPMDFEEPEGGEELDAREVSIRADDAAKWKDSKHREAMEEREEMDALVDESGDVDGDDDGVLTRAGQTPNTMQLVEVIKRMATVRYFSQMNPGKVFPLSVRFTKERLQEWVKRGVSQVSGDKAIEVTKDDPFVTVRPHFPGCHVTPAERRVDLSAEESEATFTVSPFAAGRMSDATVQIHYQGKVAQTIATPTRITTQMLSRVTATASFLSPAYALAMQATGNDLTTQARDGFPLLGAVLEAVGGPFNLGLIAGAVLLVAAGLFFWWKMPKKSDPLYIFYNGPGG